MLDSIHNNRSFIWNNLNHNLVAAADDLDTTFEEKENDAGHDEETFKDDTFKTTILKLIANHNLKDKDKKVLITVIKGYNDLIANISYKHAEELQAAVRTTRNTLKTFKKRNKSLLMAPALAIWHHTGLKKRPKPQPMTVEQAIKNKNV